MNSLRKDLAAVAVIMSLCLVEMAMGCGWSCLPCEDPDPIIPYRCNPRCAYGDQCCTSGNPEGCCYDVCQKCAGGCVAKCTDPTPLCCADGSCTVPCQIEDGGNNECAISGYNLCEGCSMPGNGCSWQPDAKIPTGHHKLICWGGCPGDCVKDAIQQVCYTTYPCKPGLTTPFYTCSMVTGPPIPDIQKPNCENTFPLGLCTYCNYSWEDPDQTIHYIYDDMCN
jgi:hypothetical protein